MITAQERRRPSRQLIGDDRHHLVSRRQRICWRAGILFAFCLIAIYGVMAQRDDAARIADAGSRRMSVMLSRARCAPPNAPLEKLVGPMASQSDGKTPTVECVYVTSDLGVVPKLRFTAANIVEAAR